jgi:uncharacterized cysteine cluster protein YcgN (CxxCxxCC family)
LLDLKSLRCSGYADRHRSVPDCAMLSPDRPQHLAWMPHTCAYRCLHEGRPLPEWHPLLTGNPASAEPFGAAAHGDLIAEEEADLDHLERYVADRSANVEQL